MIVHGNPQASHHHSHGGSPVTLDLVAVESRQFLTQEVDDGKGKAEEKVAGEGNQDREEGRRDQRVVLEDEVVPEGLQEPV